MNAKKIILFFYLLYTIYTILICGSSNLDFFYILPALLLIWMLYLIFHFGYNKKCINKRIQKFKSQNLLFGLNLCECKDKILILLSILSLGISIITVHYYTGQWPGQVIENMILGNSNYAYYQYYFREANISSFSLSKVPYVLAMGVKNIIFVFSFIYLICINDKIKFKHLLYLSVIAIAHLYFGMGRGTNFESYQLFVLIVYSYISHQINFKKKINMAYIIGLGIILVGIFIAVLEVRGSVPSYRISDTIFYDNEEIFSLIFSHFAIYYIFVFSYLGFGIYYIATFFNEVLLDSPVFFLGGIIPGLNQIVGNDPISITNKIVHIGVKWVPDYSIFITNFGVVLLFLLCYFLGLFLKKVYLTGNKELFYIVGYVISMFFISGPNGNFLSFSSDKILILYIAIIYIKNTYNIKIKY